MMFSGDSYRQGLLTSKPVNKMPPGEELTGVQPLPSGSERESLLYIPKNYTHNNPARLAVMLHGAGGNAEHGLWLLRSYADDRNIILFAPASRAYTWDIIAGNSFGADVIFMDQALSHLFGRFVIDPAGIAIGGFSDGASYALCIGLSNGGLFTHVIAFSPGFFHTVKSRGNPRVFISHGIRDQILPIQPCSRRIVPQLQRRGIEVAYQEFDGEHEIPAPISLSAIEWFTHKK